MKSQDSAWFERQYGAPGARYNKIYCRPLNYDVFQTCLYHASRIASITQPPIGARVFEVGAGVGWHMEAFRYLGYDAHGVEISDTAVQHAHESVRDRIVVDDARSHLKGLPPKSEGLLYTQQTLEHFHRDELPELIADMARVSHVQAHSMAADHGGDPSHITIEPPSWWIAMFGRTLGPEYLCIMVPDPIYPITPIVFVFPSQEVPEPVRYAMRMRMMQRRSAN